MAKLFGRLLLGLDARAAQRLAETRRLVSMMPTATILHVESVQERTQHQTKATVRINRTNERRDAWSRTYPPFPAVRRLPGHQ